MKSILLSTNEERLSYVYREKQRAAIRNCSEVLCENVTMDNLFEFPETEVIFSTWGMPNLSPEELDKLPNLKAVFYSAGAVRSFGQNLLDRGIKLFSAWQMNAIPVAEFTLAQVILASQGYFHNIADYRKKQGPEGMGEARRGLGLYDIDVAIIGGGAIGQLVMNLLKDYKVNVKYVASRPNKREISLEEAFKTCYIVSNHLPNREDNQNVITGEMIASMPEGGTFINTGRGAQVDEAGLVEAMKARQDLTALLDVTKPEPMEPNCELSQLPNVHVSTHISGSMNNEVLRMSDCMIDEFMAWEKGATDSDNEVTQERFEAMA